jgi:hypothetical protein
MYLMLYQKHLDRFYGYMSFLVQHEESRTRNSGRRGPAGYVMDTDRLHGHGYGYERLRNKLSTKKAVL